jgi:hypothetical protein
MSVETAAWVIAENEVTYDIETDPFARRLKSHAATRGIMKIGTIPKKEVYLLL